MYTAVNPIKLTKETVADVVEIADIVIAAGHGTTPVTVDNTVSEHVSDPSVAQNATLILKFWLVFNVGREISTPLETVCKVLTLTVCVITLLRASLIVITVLPAQSLNVAGIVDPWKLKFRLVISPFVSMLPVTYPNTTLSHPVGQQLFWIFTTAVYISSITTHAFCMLCAKFVGVTFHPAIEP